MTIPLTELPVGSYKFENSRSITDFLGDFIVFEAPALHSLLVEGQHGVR